MTEKQLSVIVPGNQRQASRRYEKELERTNLTVTNGREMGTESSWTQLVLIERSLETLLKTK